MPEIAPHRRRDFRDGFIATLPLWLGDVPFALAFASLAHTSGFSKVETMAMSLFVFAGSAQLAMVDLTPEHAGYLAILLTVLLLNLRHVLYALTLDLKLAHPRSVPRPILAAGMTDEGMGLTLGRIRSSPPTDWFFMGTVVSLYGSFAVATLLGVILLGRVRDPELLHLDVIFPLTFLALLLPLIRNRRSALIAVTGACLSVGLKPLVGSSNAVLLAILGGAAIGLFFPSPMKDELPLDHEDLPR